MPSTPPLARTVPPAASPLRSLSPPASARHNRSPAPRNDRRDGRSSGCGARTRLPQFPDRVPSPARRMTWRLSPRWPKMHLPPKCRPSRTPSPPEPRPRPAHGHRECVARGRRPNDRQLSRALRRRGEISRRWSSESGRGGGRRVLTGCYLSVVLLSFAARVPAVGLFRRGERQHQVILDGTLVVVLPAVLGNLKRYACAAARCRARAGLGQVALKHSAKASFLSVIRRAFSGSPCRRNLEANSAS